MDDSENTQLTPKITPKERAFIDEYFRCNMNGTEAYQSVYPKAKYDTARTNSSQLLAKTNIQYEINRILDQRAMASNEVLSRLSAMARASLLPFVNIQPDGFVYFDFSHPDAKEYLFLIKKIKTKRTRRMEGKGEDAEEWEDEWMEVELHDSQAALEKLGKYHKLFVDKTELSGPNNGPLIVKVLKGVQVDDL